jgi:starch phosphorylase
MGRTFDNALLNLGLKDQYKEGVTKLGFNLEDIMDQERDAALGENPRCIDSFELSDDQ